MSTTVRHRVRPVTEDASVTPLELFFDLVFVYALTQVTALMAADSTGGGVLHGMIVLALFWWCWVGYSWLGNVVQADEGLTRATFFFVMAVMFVASLSIPEAFDDLPGGLDAPLVLAVCYALVRLAHLGLFALAAEGDAGLAHQLVLFGAVMLVSISLVIAGALVGGSGQVGLWIAALVVDFGGTQAIGASGWRLRSAGHFAERHGLIVIVALGESIVAIGVGVTHLPISTSIVIAGVLGIALAAAMWWAYFDVVARVGEHVLAGARGERRARLARDSYSYLHLPMIAGIVLAALGLKKVLGYVGGEDGHDWSYVMHGLPVYALHAGLALYLLAHVCFRLRNVRTLNRQRLFAAALVLALIPVGERIGALMDLLLVSGLAVALIAYEAMRHGDIRDRVRHHLEEEQGEVPRLS
jgi:low temperature requirement protein LtrA